MFKVGDQVVCINDVFDPRSIELIPNRPKKDNVYTIRDMRYYNMLDKTGVLLVEIKNSINVYDRFSKSFQEPTFSLHRFVPIDKLVREDVLEEELELEEFL